MYRVLSMTRLYSNDHLVRKLMRRPGVCTEVERIERKESALLDACSKHGEQIAKGSTSLY